MLKRNNIPGGGDIIVIIKGVGENLNKVFFSGVLVSTESMHWLGLKYLPLQYNAIGNE